MLVKITFQLMLKVYIFSLNWLEISRFIISIEDENDNQFGSYLLDAAMFCNKSDINYLKFTVLAFKLML